MSRVPYSSKADIQSLVRSAWPLSFRIEVAALEATDPVVAGSIRAYRRSPPHTADEETIVFVELRRHQPACMIDSRIQPVEPIAFVYRTSSIGLDAPRIYSDRADFPADLPHLNLVERDSPVSICIARDGTQMLYDQGGIAAVIEELTKWMTDAAAGQLQHDGWEPTPVSGIGLASLDAAWFQEQAYTGAIKDLCSLIGLADLVFIERNSKIVSMCMDLHTPALVMPDVVTQRPKRHENKDEEKRYEATWFFACGPREEPIGQRDILAVHNEDDLFERSKLARCAELLRHYLQTLVPKLPSLFQLHACVVLGTWRPDKLIPDIPGLASGEPRRLELSAYFVKLANVDNAWRFEKVYQLKVVPTPTAETLAVMSGLKRPPEPCAIVGCGALGSKIGSYLTREGTKSLVLIDSDTMAPHNLARHELGRQSLGLNKAKELKRSYEHILGTEPGAERFSVRARPTLIDKLNTSELREVIGIKPTWIIDATADRRALIRLCGNDQKRSMIRVEIADQGRLGLLYAEGEGRSPRADDLEAMLYLEAQNNPVLAAWLSREHHLRGVLTGFGCASPTMVMPDSHVALHAASFMPVINACLCDDIKISGIGVNLLSENGHPAGWTWIAVPPFTVMVLDPATDREEKWELRLHPKALDDATAAMRLNSPREAGGYLYGRYEASSRVITVTSAFAATALQSTTTSLVLPPAGQTAVEKQLRQACGDTLIVVGSWHSHPTSSPQISGTDRTLARQIARDNRDTPRPMVMLILSPTGPRGYVVYPENW